MARLVAAQRHMFARHTGHGKRLRELRPLFSAPRRRDFGGTWRICAEIAEQVKIFRRILAESSRFRHNRQSEPLTAPVDGDKIKLLRFEAICPEVRRIFEL
ncbi:MAG: hypothetical protein Q4F18_04305 [Clostridia bacterium]|nr:hypothetical protein [Clostridia bacterium]